MAAGGSERQQHLARRHRVERYARPGPVAHDDRVGRVDLVDVVDQVAVGDATARRPRRPTSARLGEAGPAERRQRPRRRRTRRRASRAAARGGTGVARDLLDGALARERRQQARRGRLGERRPFGHLGHAERPLGEGAEHRKGASDGLDAGHRHLLVG